MREKAFLVSTHRLHIQAGTPAEILGVQFTTPRGLPERVCYLVRFPDGREDLIPLAEAHHFEIVSEGDVKRGLIPSIIH